MCELGYLKKVVGGRKQCGTLALEQPAHTASLCAEKKTKCQAGFLETAAGAAVGMETGAV